MLWTGRSWWPLFPDAPRRGRLIVIFGPSGVGKGAIEREVMKEVPLRLVVSATTRPARPDEADGEDYHFVSAERFEQMRAGGEFLEWAEYSGHRYGTPRRDVEAILSGGGDALLEIELEGARQVRAVCPDAVLIFIAPPSRRELIARLRGRGDTSEHDIRRRLAIAQHEMEEARGLYDHLVVNDDLQQAAARVVGILQPFKE